MLRVRDGSEGPSAAIVDRGASRLLLAVPLPWPCDSQSAIVAWMVARDVLLVARRRAGLTQRQLASRMGCPQSTIGRWESGSREPSFADVSKALGACGFELGQWLFNRDASLVYDASTRLELEPLERVRKLHASDELVATLVDVAASGLACVVVGEVAGALQGWPLSLAGRVLELAVDEDENDRDRLLALLTARGAQPTAMTERRPRWQAQSVKGLLLPAGTSVELMHAPAGIPEYHQLAASADRMSLDGAQQRVASVHDLIVMAEASPITGAPGFIPALYAVLDARRAGPPRRLAYDSPEGQAALAGWLSSTAA
ncbi:MAG: helix-turn-helix domain-containing protein [Solirubrobacteraceae bacterium]